VVLNTAPTEPRPEPRPEPPATTVPLDQVLAFIDARLEAVQGRGVLSGPEVTDVLLDLRSELVETVVLESVLLVGEPTI
jgi:hypothetical protein